MRTPQEVRALFDATGISVADWARNRGFPVELVYRVLQGKARMKRGLSFRIGVELGLVPQPSTQQRRMLSDLGLDCPEHLTPTLAEKEPDTVKLE